MFYMSWSWCVATTRPLIPLVIAYLPVQTVLTLLHGYLLNGNAAMDSKGMDINSNNFLHTAQSLGSNDSSIDSPKTMQTYIPQ
jgi:hypothetical protein